jgi:hypothetical protein
MDDLHIHIFHRKKNIQFFPAFPDQSLLLGFARLYLAAYELPKKGSCFI